MPEVQSLVSVRETDAFAEDKGSVEAALANARRFAKAEPFADRQEAGEAADAIKELNNARRDVDKRRLDITAPYRATTDAVNAEYKELLAPIGAAEAALKRKGLAFKKAEADRIAAERKAEQERIDREAEAKAEEAQAAAELLAEEPESEEAKQLASEAHSAAARAAVATPASALTHAPPKKLRGDLSTLGSYTVWKGEVVDPALVPLRHRIVDPRSIDAAIKAESRAAKAEQRPFALTIPGIRIYPEERAVSR